MKVNRFSKITLVLGIVFIVLSVIAPIPISNVTSIYANSYRGYVFRASSNQVTINVVDGLNSGVTIVGYVFDLDNTQAFISSGELEKLVAVDYFSFEGDYTKSLNVPVGVYSLFLTISADDGLSSNSDVRVSVSIQQGFHMELAVFGFVVLATSLITELVFFCKQKSKKYTVKI